jgi:hypothetical protein
MGFGMLGFGGYAGMLRLFGYFGVESLEIKTDDI